MCYVFLHREQTDGFGGGEWQACWLVPWFCSDLLFFLNPRKTRVGKIIEKVKKNGEANVPSGRPTQNCCATKQNWNEITKQKCVIIIIIIIIIIQENGDWYTGRWWAGGYIWNSEERSGRGWGPRHCWEIGTTTCEMVAVFHRRPCSQHFACCSVNSRHIRSESRFLPIPPAFDTSVRRVPVGISPSRLVLNNWNGVDARLWKKFEDIFIRFWHNARTWQTHRDTETHTDTA